MASSPVSDGNEILTSPLTMTNSASPGSPRWKITSPRRKRRARIAPRAVRARPDRARRRTGSPRGTRGWAVRRAWRHRSVCVLRADTRPVGTRLCPIRQSPSIPQMSDNPRGAPASYRARMQHGRSPSGHAGRGVPRGMGRDRRPARRRPGRDPQSAARARPARADGGRRSATCMPTTISTSWGCATSTRGASGRTRLPIHLPPGGRARLDALSTAVSERVGFFDAAFDVDEYDPGRARDRRPARCGSSAAATTCRPGASRSRPPTGPASPTPATRVRRRRRERRCAAPTSCSSRRAGRRGHDDPERGHLTAEEAIALAAPRRCPCGAPRPLRLGTARRELQELCAYAGPWVRPAIDG